MLPPNEGYTLGVNVARATEGASPLSFFGSLLVKTHEIQKQVSALAEKTARRAASRSSKMDNDLETVASRV